MGKCADLLERKRNALNWADPAVSLVTLGLLSAAAAAASLLLWLVAARHLCFGCGMMALAPSLARAAGWSQPAEAAAADAAADAAAADAPRAGRSPSPGLRMLHNVLGRIPDGKDIAHRHFCEAQVLEESAEGGASEGTEEEAVRGNVASATAGVGGGPVAGQGEAAGQVEGPVAAGGSAGGSAAAGAADSKKER